METKRGRDLIASVTYVRFHEIEMMYVICSSVPTVSGTNHCFGQAKHHESHYEELFGCKKESYLFKYLGIPLHY
jgi:hypothetical protein